MELAAKAAESVGDEGHKAGLGVEGVLLVLVDLGASSVLGCCARDAAAVGRGHGVYARVINQDGLPGEVELTIRDEFAIALQVKTVDDVIGGGIAAEKAHDGVVGVGDLSLERVTA